MLRAELVEDDGTRRRAVSEVAPTGGRVEGVHHGVGEVLEGPEGVLQHDPHELPVTGGGVLAQGTFGQSPEARLRAGSRVQGLHALDVPEAQTGEIGQCGGGGGEGVIERVRALVSEAGRIRERAHADGVENDEGDGHAAV